MTTTLEGTLHRVAFFGGGSGGHLYPGLALAERARERFPEFRAVFFRSSRRVEDRVFSGVPFATRRLEISSPGGARGWLRYSWKSVSAVRRVREILREGFDAAVGLGGYASVPGIVAARREGIPVVLLEQNQVPGRVNRLLAPWVSAVTCPTVDVARLMRGRIEVTGNPVRRMVLDACDRRESFDYDRSGARRVLVVGGSQGAHGLNAAILGALDALSGQRERLHWTHVTGEADFESTRAAYAQRGWNAHVLRYADDLPLLMADSDLVITRAGGTTLAEITALGVPAILVPYPYHVDQHQRLNAQVLERSGAARILEESRLNAASLGAAFDGLLWRPEALREMAARSRALGCRDAADRVLDLLLELRASCRRASVSSC